MHGYHPSDKDIHNEHVKGVQLRLSNVSLYFQLSTICNWQNLPVICLCFNVFVF